MNLKEDPPRRSLIREPQKSQFSNGPSNAGREVLNGVRKFAWDLLGTVLFLLAALLFLGTFQFSQGVIINPLVAVVKRGLGWGIYLFILILAMLGWACFHHSAGKRLGLSLGQVISLEGLYFTIISLFSIFGGFSLERASAGMDGGVIGWGLAQFIYSFLPPPIGTIFILLLSLIFVYFGFGLSTIVSRNINEWANSTARPIPTAEEARAGTGEARAAKIEGE